MKHTVAKALSVGIIVLWSTSSSSTPREDMKIVRQIILSPTHKVAP
jgi:hypothetical protein